MGYGPYDDDSSMPPWIYNGASGYPGGPWPWHSGDCGLLTGYCASTQYTLIDGGPTAYYAPFVGCNGGKHDCCPFRPKTAVGTGAASSTVYPQPQNSKGAVLDSCPTDYYTISGSCCPSSYTPWTAQLGGETPCASTVTGSTTAALSVTGLVKAAAATKPTVTVTDTVFAMQYAVASPNTSPTLSNGAIAGIAVGCAAAITGLLTLCLLIRRRLQSRRHKKLTPLKDDNFYTGTSEIPTTTTTKPTHLANIPPGAGEEDPYYTTDPPPYRLRDTETKTPRRHWPQLLPHMWHRSSSRRELERWHELSGGSSSNTPELPARVEAGPEGEDVQLARWERLSRGQPKVVYTPRSGHGSVEGMPVELAGGVEMEEGGLDSGRVKKRGW